MRLNWNCSSVEMKVMEMCIRDRTYIERCMMKACKYDLVIYAAHTNLDKAAGGVNFRLAELIGLENVRVLSPQKGALLKLVTFVPEA